jgi:hypothetical protein
LRETREAMRQDGSKWEASSSSMPRNSPSFSIPLSLSYLFPICLSVSVSPPSPPPCLSYLAIDRS